MTDTEPCPLPDEAPCLLPEYGPRNRREVEALYTLARMVQVHLHRANGADGALRECIENLTGIQKQSAHSCASSHDPVDVYLGDAKTGISVECRQCATELAVRLVG